MNKQQLNHAFDSCNPTEEQKRRMLDNIMTKKSSNTIKWRKIYIPATGIAAAALIFVVSSGVLAPYTAPDNNLVAVNEQTQADTSAIAENNAALDAVSQQRDVVAVTDKTSSAADSQQGVAKTNAKSDVTADSAPVKSDKAGAKSEQRNTQTVAETEIISGEAALALNINTASAPVREKAANVPMMAMDAAGTLTDSQAVADDSAVTSGGGSQGGSGGAAMSGDSSAAKGYEMTYAQFCSQTGTDIKSKISVPRDMSDITDDSKYIASANQTVFDWDVVYTGEDARIINISISTDEQQNRQYFENNSFVKTSINGNNAVIIYDGSSYTAYVNINNAAYAVNTNITEQELAQLLVSMTK
ncbi:MAG: hypothetical protein IJ365_04620 [Clostridia bacterium]|nr:hypothetical protein [Clostridia bacterium]